MIYTLGLKEKYEELFDLSAAAGKPYFKVGRRDDYQGGSVWRTREEVEAHIADNQPRLKGYAVYGVEADWETDTEPSLFMPWSVLLVDRPLVRLEADESR